MRTKIKFNMPQNTSEGFVLRAGEYDYNCFENDFKIRALEIDPQSKNARKYLDVCEQKLADEAKAKEEQEREEKRKGEEARERENEKIKALILKSEKSSKRHKVHY